MATRSQVLSDIALLRQSLRRAGSPHLPLLKLQGWRPALDVAVRKRAGMIWSVSMLVAGNATVRERICVTAGMVSS